MPVELRNRRTISFHDVAANVGAGGTVAFAANNATVSASSSGGSFPTFESTGPRTSLTTDTRTTVGAGSYSGRNFVNGLAMDGVSNVTFTDCRIAGWNGGTSGSNRVLNYCDIDGNESGAAAAAGGYGLTADHCRMWNGANGFFDYGGSLLTDCFLGELYLSGEAHGEPLMCSGSNSEFDHCTFLGQFKAGGNALTGPGGISACVALYTHGDWGSRSNVYVHDCLMSAPDANHVAYWGTAGIAAAALTNCDFVNNIIRKPSGSTTGSADSGVDIEVDYFGGSGNNVTGNVYEDSGLPCGGND